LTLDGLGAPAAAPAAAPGGSAPPAVPVVGIGASAGGLEALRDMLAPARAPTGFAFVIVQHLDPNHESMLAQLLDRQTALTVLQSEGGERLAPDHVYIIPPGRGLALRGGVLELTDFAQPRGLRRPIDDFFASLASDQQANAACVILSGTGADGTTGLRAVKEHGGLCVVQQPETARYDGMPLSAVGTGLVDFVRPPGEILGCLTDFFRRRTGDPASAREAGVVADHLDDLCRVLRTAVGHDFSGYKRSTLVRRVERRMHVLGVATGRAYLDRVRGDGHECEALFRDLLINVTRFFRDADAFDVLRTRAVEPLLRNHAGDEDLRVWVPGCSSGEEAYTIAMLFADAARAMDRRPAVQIFATDIDEQMLAVAREGTYPASALADIPADMRERYTVPHPDRFTVAASIRDMIRFSSHSLVKDPPFSRIDLLSCRNLLIYFADRLQQSIMPLLHYSVRPGGYLFLGSSESVGRYEQLFPLLDGPARLFERSPGAPSYPIDLPAGPRAGAPRRDGPERAQGPVPALEDAAVRRVADRYAPASLVLDQDGAILAAYGKLGRYFEFPVTRTGGSSAVSLARPGLRAVLGPLLRQAQSGGRRRLVARDVEVETDHGVQPVEVVCDPLTDGAFLFVFRDTGPFRAEADHDLTDLEPGEDRLEALEDELRLTRHRLRSAVEELETANEELKSSNEEMMSMNEELQSTNEELSTVNDELKGKVEQLTVANSDLRNFFESTDLAVVVVDADLRVRSFTDAATAVFPLKIADKGRPLADVSSRLDGADHLDDARAVAAGGAPVRRRMRTHAGNVYSLRVRPYRTMTGATDGATLVFTDITDALALERQLAAERERLDLAIRAGGIGVWEYCPETGEASLDGVGRTLFGLDADEARRRGALIARVDPDDRAAVEEGLARAAAGGADFDASFRIRDGARDGGEGRRLKAFGRLIADSRPPRLVGVSIDVTGEYAVAETRDLMLREMNHRVKNLFAVIGGMVTAGARSHTDVRVFAEDVRERIAALGRAHSLASPTGREEQAVDLPALIAATLAPYRAQAPIALDGPPVLLDRACLSPLALLLHEWATNSVKYGALGAGEAGRLEIAWGLEGSELVLRWVEAKPADTFVAAGRGFGTLLSATSARQLRATVGTEAVPGRFALTLALPGSALSRD